MKLTVKVNAEGRLEPSLPMLACFACYIIWQMGIAFFSSDALSLVSRTPLPADTAESISLAVYVAGYVLSTLLILFFRSRCIMMSKVTLTLALAATLALYLPLDGRALLYLYYLQVLCGVLMIGFTICTIVNLFSQRAELKDILLNVVPFGLVIAVVQNDFFRFDYAVFRVITVAVQLAMLFFFFSIPEVKQRPCVKRGGGQVRPVRFSVGIYTLVILSCFMLLFSGSIAGSVEHGVSLFYAGGAFFGLIIGILWKTKKANPLTTIKICVAVAALGFLLAVAAVELPALRLPSIALMGAGNVVCSMSAYLGIVLSAKYNSRFIAPAIVSVGLVTVVINGALLELLRDNPVALFVIYAIISVVLAVLYLVIEPYLLYSARQTAVAPQPQTAPARVNSPRLEYTDSAYDHLTGQEINIANYILQGYTGSEISRLTNLTESTVKTYRKTLYSKLQIHSRSELFELASKAAAAHK